LQGLVLPVEGAAPRTFAPGGKKPFAATVSTMLPDISCGRGAQQIVIAFVCSLFAVANLLVNL